MKRGPKWFAQKAGRRDANHASIRDALRALGHKVIDTAGVGDDVPDLCVYVLAPRRVRVAPWLAPVWLEVKTPEGEATPGQLDWAAEAKRWGIKHAFVESLAEALEVLR